MRRRRFLKRDSGIAFTDESYSQMTAAQINPSYGKTVSGEYSNILEWGIAASNVYVCDSITGNHTTSLDPDDPYLLIAEYGSNRYVLRSYNGNVTAIAYVPGMSLDNHYKWNLIEKTKGYDFKNIAENKYAYVTDKGVFGVSDTTTDRYFSISASTLVLSYSYKPGTTWVPYMYSDSQIRLRSTSGYTAKIYSISASGRNVTLSPLSDTNSTINGTNRALVLKDSNNLRYLVGVSGTSFTLVAISPNQANDNQTMTFKSTSIANYISRYRLTISGSNGSYSVQFQNGSKYLTPPTGTLSASSYFSLGNSAVTMSYNDTLGFNFTQGYNLGPFGVTNIIQGFTVSSYAGDLSAGGTAVLFQWDGSSWSPYYGQLQTGGQYAVVIKGTGNWCVLKPIYNRTWADTGHTYFADGTITSNNETIVSGVTTAARETGYDLMKNGNYLVYTGAGFSEEDVQPSTYFTIVDGELVWNYSTTVSDATTWYTKTFGVTTAAWEFTCTEYATLAECVITSDCVFTATQGSNGFTLMQGSNGVNVNNNQLALLAVSLEWAYIPNSTTPENSRLWSVSSSTVTYYPEYANGDLEANTAATDTLASCYLVQNGKVQTYVDELVGGETYVIVFKSCDNHYAACVSGTDIVPVLYANKLPKKLTNDFYFTASSHGNGFYLTNGQNRLGVSNLKLSVGSFDATWTYDVGQDSE